MEYTSEEILAATIIFGILIWVIWLLISLIPDGLNDISSEIINRSEKQNKETEKLSSNDRLTTILEDNKNYKAKSKHKVPTYHISTEENSESESYSFSPREKYSSPAITILFLERLSNDMREKAFSDIESILKSTIKEYGVEIKDMQISLTDTEIKDKRYLQYAKLLTYLEYLKSNSGTSRAYRFAILDINAYLEDNYEI